MTAEPVDCRSTDGVTIGLIDTIITASRVLRDRPLSGVPVREALADLAGDEDVAHLLWIAELSAPTLGTQLLDARAEVRRQTDLADELRRQLEFALRRLGQEVATDGV